MPESHDDPDDTTTVADLIAAEIARGLDAPGEDVCGPLRALLPTGTPGVTINVTIENINFQLPAEAFQ